MRGARSALSGVIAEAGKLGRSAVFKILGAGPLPAHFAIIMDGNRRYANRERIGRKDTSRVSTNFTRRSSGSWTSGYET